MRLVQIVFVLLCIALAVQAMPQLEKRKGGGGHGGGGHGGGGKPGGGGSKPGGSSSKPVNTGTSTSSSGGGGTSGKGSGTLGDRPPSYASLYPSRPNFNAGGRPSGSGNSAHSYTPPPAYAASASYATASRGQTVAPYTFNSKSPSVYYASTSRSSYPGAWGYGFYPIYPYPWWAYGAGAYVGASYITGSTNHGVNSYKSELRNMTVVNATNIPLIGDQNIFNTTSNITFVDFNNGSVQIAPCGNSSSSALQVAQGDCDFIVLNLRNGTVVKGHASASVHDEITFFELKLGNRTSVLRMQTISSTKKKPRGGIIAGIVLGVVGFVVLAIVATCLIVRWRRRH
ncbi:hypothetical protein IW148_002569 [Coemansia sp. RSA 1199]|nr:hypothetical protein IW148_002569 [Coemansia sp. RSA 1199]